MMVKNDELRAWRALELAEKLEDRLESIEQLTGDYLGKETVEKVKKAADFLRETLEELHMGVSINEETKREEAREAREIACGLGEETTPTEKEGTRGGDLEVLREKIRDDARY